MLGGEELQGVGHAHTLVPSDHVETAPVYGRGGEKIGTIERLMLEKKSGTVAYAVVKCGGLLKGELRHYPVSWDSLKYDVACKAYTTNLTLEELRSGPSELDGEAFDWGDCSAVYRHPQYWLVQSSQPAARVYATAGTKLIVGRECKIVAPLPMKYLGKPPATPTGMAIQVFRCDGCNVIGTAPLRGRLMKQRRLSL